VFRPAGVGAISASHPVPIGEWKSAVVSEIRPRRSVLYMPGSNARALEKARSLPADALIFDLEDAVAPDAKASAREQVCAAVRAGGYGPRETIIRVNGLATRCAWRSASWTRLARRRSCRSGA
jgi:HpcH/HpaI aldolase/citrate lyase family